LHPLHHSLDNVHYFANSDSEILFTAFRLCGCHYFTCHSNTLSCCFFYFNKILMDHRYFSSSSSNDHYNLSKLLDNKFSWLSWSSSHKHFICCAIVLYDIRNYFVYTLACSFFYWVYSVYYSCLYCFLFFKIKKLWLNSVFGIGSLDFKLICIFSL
jgi:hypothetical protein